MRQEVKDFLNSKPRYVSCGHLHKISGGYSAHGGDYDAAQSWLAANGYRYEIKEDAWLPNGRW